MSTNYLRFKRRQRPIIVGRVASSWRFGLLFCLLICLTTITDTLWSQSGSLPELIPTRQRKFGIPFEVKPNDSADPPKEIELLVSRDRGVRWFSAGRQSVGVKQFEYQAEADGEYWFSFRTITTAGIVKHSNQGPHLRVLVDATAPKIDCEIKPQSNGQVRVDWRLRELFLQEEGLKFAALPRQHGTETNWSPLNVDIRQARRNGDFLEGSFLFWPDRLSPTGNVSEFDFRIVAIDRAGNRTEKIETIDLLLLRRNDKSEPVTDSIGAKQNKQATEETAKMKNKSGTDTSSKNTVDHTDENTVNNIASNKGNPNDKPIIAQTTDPSPDAPVRFGEQFDRAIKAIADNTAEESDSLYVMSRRQVIGQPLTPPKPTRMTKKTAKPKIETKSTETNRILSEKYQPAPMLGLPTGENFDEESFLERNMKQNDPRDEDLNTTMLPPSIDPIGLELLSKLDRFYEGRLTADLAEETGQNTDGKDTKQTKISRTQSHGTLPGKEGRKDDSGSDHSGPTLSAPMLRPLQHSPSALSPEHSQAAPRIVPAEPNQVVANNRSKAIRTLPPIEETNVETASNSGIETRNGPMAGKTEKTETGPTQGGVTKTTRPGGITGISLNMASGQPQIIVKWHSGDATWQAVQTDILRAETLQGPWLPMATNLRNTGEYWWFVSQDDFRPFHVMVRMRTLGGVVGSDATQQPIRINPAMLQSTTASGKN